MLPPDRQVDCSCDVALELPVLMDQTGTNDRITACMCCGKIEFVESMVDEPRPHDVRCVGNVVQKLDKATREWLEKWPRRLDDWSPTPLGGEYPYAFLPATVRCADVKELTEQRQRAFDEQKGKSFRERLLILGFPTEAPTADSRHAIKAFAEIWRGLTLSSTADLKTILSLSGYMYEASPFAGQDVAQRDDFRAAVLRLAASNKRAEWRRGFGMLEEHQMKDAEVFKVLEAQINNASVKPDAVRPTLLACAVLMDELCNLLYALRPESAVVIPALNKLAKRIGDKDYYLRKQCLDTAENIVR